MTNERIGPILISHNEISTILTRVIYQIESRAWTMFTISGQHQLHGNQLIYKHTWMRENLQDTQRTKCPMGDYFGRTNM